MSSFRYLTTIWSSHGQFPIMSTVKSANSYLKSTMIRSSLTTLNIVRKKSSRLGFSKDLVRVPIRVYKNEEEARKAEQKLKMKDHGVQGESPATATQQQRKEPSQSSILFGKVMSEISENKSRKRIILEGAVLIEEALKSGNGLEYLFILKSIKEIPEPIKKLLNENAQVHRVSEQAMFPWSSVKTPPGIIGVCKKPKLYYSPSKVNDITANSQKSAEGQPQDQQQQPHQICPAPLTVICDNLREPGNLGSILRSAAGAGCKRILLSKGCVDAWETKVLRGGCGAHFHLPIMSDIPLETLGNFMQPEQAYLDERASSKTSRRPFKTGIFLADSNRNDSRSNLPIFPYTDINYTDFDEIYLVIGGETVGLTDEVLKLSDQFHRGIHFPTTTTANDSTTTTTTQIARIHIPLQYNFDSLNAANAFGIIVFEIVRQLKIGQKA